MTTECPREFVGDPCSKDSRSRWYNAVHRRRARAGRFDTPGLAEKRCLNNQLYVSNRAPR